MLRLPGSVCCDWSPTSDEIMIALGNNLIVKDSTLHYDRSHYDNIFNSNSRSYLKHFSYFYFLSLI